MTSRCMGRSIRSSKGLSSIDRDSALACGWTVCADGEPPVAGSCHSVGHGRAAGRREGQLLLAGGTTSVGIDFASGQSWLRIGLRRAGGFEGKSARAIAAAATAQQLRSAKIGVVGTHAPGFLDLAAEPFLICKAFGLQLHPLSLLQFIERVQGTPADAVSADLQRVRSLCLRSSPRDAVLTDELLSVNSRFYLSIQELMRENRLNALALQCWPELPNIVGQWPYFAVSRLGSEGTAISIEGDVDGAIGSLIGRMLGVGPGFLSDWLGA
jgi:L-fucose isomerase-like protein